MAQVPGSILPGIDINVVSRFSKNAKNQLYRAAHTLCVCSKRNVIHSKTKDVKVLLYSKH